MSHKLNKNTFTLAIGATALAGTMAMATATANPFAMNALSAGYGVQGAIGAKGEEGKCGEGKCGAKMEKKGKAEGTCGEGKCGAGKKDDAKAGEGKCGEGKCGMDMMDADKDGKVTKEEFMAAHEKMFAAKDTNKDGALDAAEIKAAKASKEGKCGEGKCGGKK